MCWCYHDASPAHVLPGQSSLRAKDTDTDTPIAPLLRPHYPLLCTPCVSRHHICSFLSNPISDSHPFLHSRLSLSYLSWNQFKFCLLNCDHLFLKQDQTQATLATNITSNQHGSCFSFLVPQTSPSSIPPFPPRALPPGSPSLHTSPLSPPLPSRHPSPLHFLPTYDRFSRKQSRTKKTNISPTPHIASQPCHHRIAITRNYQCTPSRNILLSFCHPSHTATPMRRRCQKRASAGGLKALGNLSVAPRGLSPPDQLI